MTAPSDKELRSIASGAWASKDEWESMARELLAARKVVRAIKRFGYVYAVPMTVHDAIVAYDKARKR